MSQPQLSASPGGSYLEEQGVPSDAATEVGFEKDPEKDAEHTTNSDYENNDQRINIPEDAERGVTDAESRSSPRDGLPSWRWITTMAALLLGGMLYGMH